MDALYAELHRWMASPFVWGEDDCMLAIANYLIRLGYPDGGKRYRGQYDSALTCQRVTGYLVDPVKPMAECVAELGMRETKEPQRGDVAVVRFRDADNKLRATGAIFLGRNWAIRSEFKVVIQNKVEMLAAWRVEPCAG